MTMYDDAMVMPPHSAPFCLQHATGSGSIWFTMEAGKLGWTVARVVSLS
jgi:hypothetical protein